MDFEKSKKSDLLVCLGAGIILEGLIFFAMSYITSFSEALNLFLVMLVISLFLGCFSFVASLRRNDKDKEIRD